METKKQMTLTDIAAAAGVSNMTVLRFLAGRPDLDQRCERVGNNIRLFDPELANVVVAEFGRARREREKVRA